MSMVAKDLGPELKKIREEKGLSLREVDKLTGISYTHLNMIENGKRNVTPALLRNLASAYNVNYLDLYVLAGYMDLVEDAMERSHKTDLFGNPVVPIPLIGTVKAGYDYLAQENWIGTVDISQKLADTGEFFALRIKGDSMIPAFFEGDIVIVKKQNDCENNQFAVVIINGDEGTLKKVKKTDEGIILQPINPAYGPVMYTNKEIKETPIIIAGVFQELRRTDIKF